MSAKKKSDSYWKARATFRTDDAVRDALSLVKFRLGRLRKVTFRFRKPTEEATFGAIMLWAADQDPDRLAEALKPYFLKLEALVGGWHPGRDAEGHAVDLLGNRIEEVTIETIDRPAAPAKGAANKGSGGGFGRGRQAGPDRGSEAD